MANNPLNSFNSANTSFNLDLPDWAVDELNLLPTFIPAVEDQMEAVIRFSRLNIQNRSGGPFSAGVFERETGKLIIIGVNRVLPFNCSSAHAEIMTLSLAQKLIGSYDLGAAGLPSHQLVVNWLPCAMCFGSVFWSGVRTLVIAGSGPELEEITGFDEGPIHPNWRAELEQRGIDLIEDVHRDKAIMVYREFAASEELVYNARRGDTE